MLGILHRHVSFLQHVGVHWYVNCDKYKATFMQPLHWKGYKSKTNGLITSVGSFLTTSSR